jgi:hypothetical protein
MMKQAAAVLLILIGGARADVHYGQAVEAGANTQPAMLACDRFAGADMGKKLKACLAALPAGGGIADARAIGGEQTITEDLFIGLRKPVRMLLGAVRLTVPATQTIRIDGTEIVGAGGMTTTWNYTGRNVAFAVEGAVGVVFADLQANAVTTGARAVFQVRSASGKDPSHLLFRRTRTLFMPEGSYVFDLQRTIQSKLDQVMIISQINGGGIQLDQDSDAIEVDNCRISGNNRAGTVGVEINSGGGNAGIHIHDSVIGNWGIGLRAGNRSRDVRNLMVRNVYFEDDLAGDIELGNPAPGGTVHNPVIEGCYFAAPTMKPVTAIKSINTSGLRVANIVSASHSGATVQLESATLDFIVEQVTSHDARRLQVSPGATSEAAHAAGGIQHARATTSCAPRKDAGNSCETQVKWPRPFRDTRYSVTCTHSQTSGEPQGLTIRNKLPDGVQVRIGGTPGTVTSGEVDCIAMHD